MSKAFTMMIATATSSMNCECSGRVMNGLISPVWSAYPKAKNAAATGSTERNGSSLSAANSTVAPYIAIVIISPCAKFTTRTTPKITDSPSAIRPYTNPVRTPAIATLTMRSQVMGKKRAGEPALYSERFRSGFPAVGGLLRLLILGDRKHRLSRGRGARQYHRGQELQVLHAGRADALDLALGVELDRPAERHLLGDVGLSDRVSKSLRVGSLGALEGVGGDQDRLESEAHVEPMKHQPVFRVLLEERLFHDLGELGVRVVPGNVGDRVLRKLAERLEILLLVHAGRSRANDAHRVPALLHHLASQQDRVVQPAHEQQEIRVRSLGLRHLDGEVLGDGVHYLER